MLYIFDWDGTISNSAEKIVHCMQVAAERAGIQPQTDAAIRNIIGLGMYEALSALYPNSDDETKETMRFHYSDYFKKEDKEPSPFFEGALETMEALRSEGYKLSVATGKSRNGLNRVLKTLGLDNFFDASRCADETKSKPHPLMLTEILDELKVPAKAAVMVGDTEYDMEMAVLAGVDRIAVSYGAHHVDRLKKFDPALCVDHFPDISAYNFDATH